MWHNVAVISNTDMFSKRRPHTSHPNFQSWNILIVSCVSLVLFLHFYSHEWRCMCVSVYTPWWLVAGNWEERLITTVLDRPEWAPLLFPCYGVQTRGKNRHAASGLTHILFKVLVLVGCSEERMIRGKWGMVKTNSQLNRLSKLTLGVLCVWLNTSNYVRLCSLAYVCNYESAAVRMGDRLHADANVPYAIFFFFFFIRQVQQKHPSP